MYRNICTYTKHGQQIVWEATWDKNGKRVEIETPINPYLYYEDKSFKEATHFSMFKKPLRYLEFKNSFERKEWIEGSKNTPLFEKLTPEKQYLLNKYYSMERTPEFIQYKLKTYFFDIEIEIKDKFPDAMLAEYPINVISIFDSLSSNMFIWCYKKDVKEIFTDDMINKIQHEINKDYEPDTKIKIFRFSTEVELLNDFLDWWELNYPDVITGWNIDGFDIPYIVNRFTKILGEASTKRLSPISWHKFAIKKTKEQKLKKFVVNYHIMGISICDYLNLYKKFIPKSQQSFKLDYIAKKDTGIGKLDYYDLGYDSMREFMVKDFPTFVKYNIIDSICVKKIDDVRHFIELMRRVCNMGLCEYECIFKSLPYIIGSLVIVSRELGVVFLTDANKSDDNKVENEGYEGAFVFPTIKGFFKNGIASFDFNSLYPNVMMSLNMSPETMVGKVISDIGDDIPDEVMIRKPNNVIVKMSKDSFNKLLETKCSIAANNVLFIKPSVHFGIIPTFCDGLYKSRVKIKSEAKKDKKEAVKIDEEIEALEKELLKLEKENNE